MGCERVVSLVVGIALIVVGLGYAASVQLYSPTLAGALLYGWLPGLFVAYLGSVVLRLRAKYLRK